MNLIDRTLNKIGFARKLPAPPQQQGASKALTRIASGISYDMQWYQQWQPLYGNPNPIIRSAKFLTEGGYGVLQTMSYHPHIYNILSVLKDWLMSRKWEIRSADPKDERENFKAAFIAWQMDRIPQIVQKKRQMMSHLEYGRSITEMILGRETVVIPKKTEKRNNKTRIITAGGTIKDAIVIRDLETKVPTAFNFDKSGRLEITKKRTNQAEYMTQPDQYIDQNGYRPLSDEELQHFLIMSHDPQFGWPEGTPLLAIMFWDYLIERATRVYRMIFAEKYGMPFLKGTYPADASPDQQTLFKEIIKGLQKNSWAMLPEGLNVDFVDAIDRAGSMDVYQNIIDACHGNMSEAALGHRHAVDSPSVGGEGAAEVKEGAVKQEKGEMYAQELDGVINDQLIRRLIDWNFSDSNGFYPYIVTQVRPEADLTKEVFRFQASYNMNIPFSLAQYREAMGLLEPMDADDIVVNTDGKTDGKPAKEDGENMENIPNSEQIPEMAPGEPGNNEAENRDQP